MVCGEKKLPGNTVHGVMAHYGTQAIFSWQYIIAYMLSSCKFLLDLIA